MRSTARIPLLLFHLIHIVLLQRLLLKLGKEESIFTPFIFRNIAMDNVRQQSVVSCHIVEFKDPDQKICHSRFSKTPHNTRMTIFTGRIRSMTGRYCFHRCLSVNISGGVQVQVGGSQVQVQVGGPRSR